MSEFILRRQLPNGERKESSPLPTKRKAAIQAGHVLHDNAGVPRSEAQEFSARLARQPLGEPLAHSIGGYIFRIDRATTGTES